MFDDWDDFVDPYDALVDLCEMNGTRVGPTFQIFAGVTSAWRIGETDIHGQFTLAVFEAEDLDEALRTVRVLNKAEALRSL